MGGSVLFWCRFVGYCWFGFVLFCLFVGLLFEVCCLLFLVVGLLVAKLIGVCWVWV